MSCRRGPPTKPRRGMGPWQPRWPARMPPWSRPGMNRRLPPRIQSSLRRRSVRSAPKVLPLRHRTGPGACRHAAGRCQRAGHCRRLAGSGRQQRPQRPSRQLAANAAFISCQHGTLKLGLSPGFEYLRSERALAALGEMLEKALGQAPKIVVETVETEHVPAETLHQRADRQRGERQQVAEAVFMDDPEVQVLIQQHGARVVSDSIRSFDE